MTLKNKVALVTGSTSGIGLGIATRLATQGANIMLNGFGDINEIEKLRHDLEHSYNIQTAYHNVDLTQPESCAELVTETTKQLGSTDILINNAGMQFVAPVEEFPREKWDQVMALNLSAAFHTIQAALPVMKKNQWGRIINIASAHGVVASKGKAAYVAAKHGLVGLTKVVALETADQSNGANITCNALCPGWVLTPLVQKQIDDRAKAEGKSVKEAELELLGEKQPALRFITPEELGNYTAYLCSDAARMITGQALLMDGGWTAQ